MRFSTLFRVCGVGLALGCCVFLAPLQSSTERHLETNGRGFASLAAGDTAQTGTSLVVNTLTASNDGVCGVSNCSLNEAIKASNSRPTTDAGIVYEISFDKFVFVNRPDVTIPFTHISQSVTITGPAAGISVRSDSPDGCFFIDSTNSNAIVTFNGLSFIDRSPRSTSATVVNQGQLVVNNSSFAGSKGGSIHNLGRLTLANCTFVGNTGNNGGALYNGGGSVSLDSCTFANNSAIGAGGGIYSSGGPLILTNTLLAGNSAPFGPQLFGNYDASYSLLESDADAHYIGNSFEAAHNQANVDAKLGHASYYGGPKWVIPVLQGSPAIDSGGTTLNFDERHTGRPVGAAKDIGAFEVVPHDAPTFSIGILKTAPTTNDSIGAYISSTEALDNQAEYTISWARTRGGVKTTLPNTSLRVNAATEDVDAGDILTLTVVSTGVYTVAAPQSKSVTIVNSPAVISSFTLQPKAPFTFETLTATAKATDPDGTKPTFGFIWFKNGVETKRTNGNKSGQDTYNLKTEGLGDKGDLINVVVNVSDGLSKTSDSRSARVLNSIPVVSVLTLAPQAPTARQTVTATYGGRDADGDELQRTYLWRIGDKILKAETGARVDLSKYPDVKPGDVVSVDLKLSDEEANSKTLSARVTVTGPAPVSAAAA